MLSSKEIVDKEGVYLKKCFKEIKEIKGGA
jgi:hypothetical protein